MNGKTGKIISILMMAGVILWCGFFLLVYYRQSPLRLIAYFQDWGNDFPDAGVNLVPIILPVIFMILTFFFSYFLGEQILKLLKIDFTPKSRYWAAPVLIGMFVISLVIYFLGIMGLLYLGILRIIFIFLSIAAAADFFLKLFRNRRRSSAPENNPDVILCWALFAAVGMVCLMYALTPPVQSDGLRYHLFAPQEYIKARGIGYLSLSAFTNSPFTIEMLFTYGMIVSGDSMAKLFHLSFWILCIFLIRAFLCHFTVDSGNTKREGFPSRDFILVFSGLLFGAIPAVCILACWSFIDLGVAAYFLGFVFSLCLYCEKRERRYAILCGIFGGAALGTKYTMLPMILLGCLLIGVLEIFQANSGEKEKSGGIPLFFRAPLVIGMISLILALPWYIKNIIHTGNPFYPLMYKWFDGKDWSAENAAFYAAKAAEKGFPRTVANLILSPLHATLLWRKFESFNPGPYALFMLPFLLWGIVLLNDKKTRKSTIILIAFSLGYYVMWFWGYQSNRFLIPFFMLTAVLSGFILMDFRKKDIWICRVLCAGLFLCILYSSAFSIRWILTETNPNPVPVFLGMETRDHYLSKALDYYPAIRAVNEDIPPKEAILCIGEHRGYYFKPRILISDWFDTPVILDFIRKTNTNEEIFDLLKERGCAHVFYNKGELDKYAERYFKPRFKDDEYRRFEEFLVSPRLKLRYRIDKVYIYTITFQPF
ncbi:hypothetical protein JW926_16920 [Candidatus Sumerlaeota bacterium]|nr:hypothetical protein [Candidatus Sumerlaeota bacterium]